MKEENVIQNSYILYPTLTSSVNIMDNYYNPKLTLGILSGNEDLKNFPEYNAENRARVLLNMSSLLDKEIGEITFEEIAAHFNSNTKKIEDINSRINHLSSLFAVHRSKQSDKIKLKLSPSPSPSLNKKMIPTPMDNSGFKNEESEKEKNKIKLSNPFKVNFNIPRPL